MNSGESALARDCRTKHARRLYSIFNRMKYIAVVFLLVLIFSSIHVHAATNTFSVSTLIGSDAIPPSTPTNVVATPVTASQIDIAWDASTDNFLMGGYQVFRDGSQIATTTLTLYSDTGLSDSTLYTYRITAFDSSYNYSTTSATSATTTLASSTPPSTPASGGSGGGSLETIPTELTDLEIVITKTTAEIFFDTNVYTSAVIRWGRTINYESGYIASDIYKKQHHTIITGLQPGTTYELEIVLSRRVGDDQYRKVAQFVTGSAPDTTAPANVSNLRAERVGNEVELSWDNPADADFSHVRAVSSELFYPSDSVDGWFVYEGNNSSVRDVRALTMDRRYYSVFTYDVMGNVSSGAVVYIDPETGSGNQQATATPEISIPEPHEVLEGTALHFSDIIFEQNENSQNSAFSPITLTRSIDTNIVIPYDMLPENLKTIVVTMTDPNDESLVFSFLLKINKDKTAYEALIGELPYVGVYNTVFEIYDYTTQTITQVSGEVLVKDIQEGSQQLEKKSTVLTYFLWSALVAIGIVTTLFLILFKLRKKDEELYEDNVL